jgi:hypothetical protein
VLPWIDRHADTEHRSLKRFTVELYLQIGPASRRTRNRDHELGNARLELGQLAFGISHRDPKLLGRLRIELGAHGSHVRFLGLY